ncbi:unnamed protein product [Adineta steineri]|uniref:Uncharacterized protein n=1 Tax=Adineta steineri TaxID=433720 RepID=A0A815P130_9BILA|nr:unnamed protein product [Adineta steineri]CAF1627317.1 unnamed protein product [Adineta steineri]
MVSSLEENVISIELSNTVYENDNSFDSENCSRYNKTTLSTILDHNEEECYIVVCQVFIPFMIAGFGIVAAGLVLEYVKELNLFKEITEIYILVPFLLGLKGNLKMTLTPRLSTVAVFHFVMNSVGDDLVAVQTSQLSTTFHHQGKPEEFQDITQYHASKLFPNPYKIFCSTSILSI